MIIITKEGGQNIIYDVLQIWPKILDFMFVNKTLLRTNFRYSEDSRATFSNLRFIEAIMIKRF